MENRDLQLCMKNAGVGASAGSKIEAGGKGE